MERKIRVLMAKPGLDGHERGAMVVSRGLRDAGMEVIYTGIRQTPEAIVTVAMQEDVDVIGLSILSGAHLPLCEEIVALLRANGMEDVFLVVGGTIPRQDAALLKEMGIGGVFGPGTSVPKIVEFIRQEAQQRGQRGAGLQE